MVRRFLAECCFGLFGIPVLACRRRETARHRQSARASPGSAQPLPRPTVALCLQLQVGLMTVGLLSDSIVCSVVIDYMLIIMIIMRVMIIITRTRPDNVKKWPKIKMMMIK